MKHIYVASPYSDEDKGVMYRRAEDCLEFVAWWYNNKPNEYVMFSPIAYMAPAERAYGLPGTWEFWSKIDLSIIDRCDEVWVLELPGLQHSRGVREEVKHAQERHIPVKIISVNVHNRYTVTDMTELDCQFNGWEWLGG